MNKEKGKIVAFIVKHLTAEKLPSNEVPNKHNEE